MSFSTIDTPLPYEPLSVEFLIAVTGETFIHSGGTAYWKSDRLDIEIMRLSGVTHYRVIHPSQLEKLAQDLRDQGDLS